VLAGLNLRIAVASVPPVIDEIEQDLGLSSAVGGLLTSLSVLCFGVVATAAPGLTRRLGAERTLLAALVPLTTRALLRDRLAWQVTLFFGTQSLLFYAGSRGSRRSCETRATRRSRPVPRSRSLR
jgi:CP family cyanate transporter-like MFS transporter